MPWEYFQFKSNSDNLSSKLKSSSRKDHLQPCARTGFSSAQLGSVSSDRGYTSVSISMDSQRSLSHGQNMRLPTKNFLSVTLLCVKEKERKTNVFFPMWDFLQCASGFHIILLCDWTVIHDTLVPSGKYRN